MSYARALTRKTTAMLSLRDDTTGHHTDETAPDTVRHSPPSADVLDLLVAQAQSGHAEALESLFTLTRTDVTRFIAGRVTSEWVEDLTQETFSRARDRDENAPRGSGPGLTDRSDHPRHRRPDRRRGSSRSRRPEAARPGSVRSCSVSGPSSGTSDRVRTT